MIDALVPFRQFVLKVHSRCDLDCDHCYIYHHADQSWRQRPRAMPDPVIFRTAERIAEHAAAHRLAQVHVVLHGGEPLLVGQDGIRRIAGALRTALDGVSALDLRIQTNGLLLDDEFCGLLADEQIKVGISLDGDRAANDRHRRYADGSSSYDRAVNAVRRIGAPEHRSAFAGILCTIDLANDPIAVYEALAALDPPRIEYLLPHATWEQPPPRPGAAVAPYAEWLIAVFEHWTAAGRPMPIRIFDSIAAAEVAGSSLTEALGAGPADLVVVETDGAIEQADSLKTAYDGAPGTGHNVEEHSFDQVATHPGFRARRGGADELCGVCRECPVVNICGGGLYAHRYRAANGFDNPSVYCEDLITLIDHVAARGRERHTMQGAAFDDLAAGFGSAQTISLLAAAQHSAARAFYSKAAQAAPARGLPQLWSVAKEVDGAAPDALAATLAYPFARAWGRFSGVEGIGGGAAATRYLCGLTAVAAIRSRRRLAVPVFAEGGTVHLPGVGRFVGVARDEAVIEAGAGGFALRFETGQQCTVSAPQLPMSLPDGVHWEPLRFLTVPDARIALDDIDPYRDCFEKPVESRLSDGEHAAWQRLFAEAWELIRRQHAAYLPGLAAGLSALVPLKPSGGELSSAASRSAFGAVGVARPERADELALLLLHEFQHVKLGALLDMYDLIRPPDGTLYPVAWREDLRPAEGALQGAYAHLAVADFWRVQGQRAKADHWNRSVTEAVDALTASGSLTPDGVDFARRMRASASGALESEDSQSATPPGGTLHPGGCQPGGFDA